MFRARSMAAAALSRRFAHSSGIVTRHLNGSHRLTIGGYNLSRTIPKNHHETSQTFEVAGYSWRILYSPHGYSNWWSGEDDCISLFLELVHGDYTGPPLNFSFTLLDQAGNPVPRYSRSKEGCTFDVHGETFHAHRWLLAARSPVFKAVVASNTKDDKSSSLCSMKIDGIEPKVFKAMLHFMYTDALPDDMLLENQDTTVVQNLLAAAQRYELVRLKLMCEEALCKQINVSTVAATLAVAEQHRCQALKAACVEFIGRPGNLKAITETQGFEKIKATCPAVLMELVMKQVA